MVSPVYANEPPPPRPHPTNSLLSLRVIEPRDVLLPHAQPLPRMAIVCSVCNIFIRFLCFLFGPCRDNRVFQVADVWDVLQRQREIQRREAEEQPDADLEDSPDNGFPVALVRRWAEKTTRESTGIETESNTQTDRKMDRQAD